MNMKRGWMLGSAFVAVVLTCAAMNAMAQTTTDTTKEKTQAEIIRLLTPTGKKKSPLKPEIDRTADKEAASPGRNPTVNVTIDFKYNSARPTTGGAWQLKRLAAALKDPLLRDTQYAVVGHTDGRGGLAYNHGLSERRANAVQGYLVREAGIEPARLHAVGVGKTQPLDPADPTSSSNRRVELINIKN